jgi:hypothetical protein
MGLPGPAGAITFSSPPNGLEFVEKGIFGSTHLTASFQRTVPACQPLAMTQVFSWAFTNAEAQTLAATPTLTAAIAAPAGGATVSTSTVTVSGTVTAGRNGLPAAISVNCQSVPVEGGGAWSAVVPLAVGANTITATTTDPSGASTSAQIAVTYAPPAAPPAPPPPVTSPAVASPTAGAGGAVVKASATITKSSYNGHEVLLTIACSAAGAACSGKATVTAKVTVTVKDKSGHRKTRTEKITVAAGNFSIAPGHSETIKLKLTRTAAKELARLGKLAATITATLSQANKTSTAVTAHLTLHKATAKKKKA